MDTGGECTVSATKFMKLDFTQLDSYKSILNAGKGFKAIDKRVFVLKDTDGEKLLSNYVIVSRRPIISGSEKTWLYSCSCDDERQSFIAAQRKVHFAEDFTSVLDGNHPQCLHMNVSYDIVRKWEAQCENDIDEEIELDRILWEGEHSYSKQTKREKVDIVSTNPHVVLYQLDNEKCCMKQAVRGNETTFRCVSCKRKCSHPAQYEKFLDTSDDKAIKSIKLSYNKPLRECPRYIATLISTEPITFSTKQPDMKKMEHFTASTEGNCRCGRLLKDGVSHRTKYIPVFTANNRSYATVCSLKCIHCGEVNEFDGRKEGILHYKNFMITHSVMYDYMHQYLSMGISIDGYHKIWAWTHIDQGSKDFLQMMPYNLFHDAWLGFLSLLDINYEDGFTCIMCGTQPKTVVMDGILLGIKKDKVPLGNPSAHSDSTCKLSGSNHMDRVLIKDSKVRKLMHLFTNKGLDKQSYTLLSERAAIHAPFLMNIIFNCEINEDLYVCEATSKTLVHELSKNYPTSSIVPFDEEIIRTIEDACQHNSTVQSDAKKMLALQRHSPLIAEVILSNSPLPDELISLLKEVLNVVKKNLHATPHTLPIPTPNEEERYYYPSLPKICERGEYVKDNKTTKKKESCIKAATRSRLSSGLLHISCEHGVCYGFEVLVCPESPDAAYTLLRTRFKTAPSLIVYDNACNLHRYALNRDPGFFENSLFTVDRFHWKNHSACTSGYNISNYSQHANVNTEIAEQRNSTLRKLDSMLSYMNFDTFMMHAKIFFWFRSKITMATLKGYPDVKSEYHELFLQLKTIYSTKI